MGATWSDGISPALAEAIERAVPEARKVVAKGCLEIKKKAQRIIRSSSKRGYLPHYPRAITYDTEIRGSVAVGEVGPEVGRKQAFLAKILENGSVNNAPVPHLSPALDAEEGTFYAHMDDLGAALLEGVDVDGPSGPS